tara:strand:- start:4523 stop:4759 length:237 start_codon:yes stop_codon:yes gene_type:complete
MKGFDPERPAPNPISQMVAEQIKKENPQHFKGKKNNEWKKVFSGIENDKSLSVKDKENKIKKVKQTRSRVHLAKQRLG